MGVVPVGNISLRDSYEQFCLEVISDEMDKLEGKNGFKEKTDFFCELFAERRLVAKCWHPQKKTEMELPPYSWILGGKRSQPFAERVFLSEKIVASDDDQKPWYHLAGEIPYLNRDEFEVWLEKRKTYLQSIADVQIAPYWNANQALNWVLFRDVLNDESDPNYESYLNQGDKDTVRFCVLGMADAIAELSRAIAAGKISVVAGTDGEVSNKKLSGITIEQGNNGRFRFCEKNETTGLGRDYPWPSLKVVSGQVVSEFPNPFKSLVNSTVARRTPDEDAELPSESIFDRKWVSLVDSVRFLSATKNVDFDDVLHSLLLKLQDEELEIEGVSLKDGKDAGPHELITRGYWSNCTTDWNDQFAGYKLTGYPVDGEIQVVLLKQDQTLAFKKLQVKSVDFCSHFLETKSQSSSTDPNAAANSSKSGGLLATDPRFSSENNANLNIQDTINPAVLECRKRDNGRLSNRTTEIQKSELLRLHKEFGFGPYQAANELSSYINEKWPNDGNEKPDAQKKYQNFKRWMERKGITSD